MISWDSLKSIDFSHHFHHFQLCFNSDLPRPGMASWPAPVTKLGVESLATIGLQQATDAPPEMPRDMEHWNQKPWVLPLKTMIFTIENHGFTTENHGLCFKYMF